MSDTPPARSARPTAGAPLRAIDEFIQAASDPMPPLGRALIDMGLIARDQFAVALADHRRSGRPLQKVLVEGSYIADTDLAQGIAQLSGLPYLDIAGHEFPASLADLIDERRARRYGAIPLEVREGAYPGGSYLVGMVDPSDLRVQDEVSALLGKPIDVVVIAASQFDRAMATLYRPEARLGEFARDVEREVDESDRVVDLLALGRSLSDADAPVVKLLQTILDEAARLNSSDIHIEPQGSKLLVRFRIDGMLHTRIEADARIGATLVVRLKLMADLDISERRLPQDGRISVATTLSRFDVRISTVPTGFGESVVMRLLRPDAILRTLEDLMPADTAARMARLVNAQNGLVLVTGPTGSGKTTTLYAALRNINHTGLKLLTCEDPVEYRILGITQVQIQEKIGLTFARVLRSFLRHDPDVILVGEIRDAETAEIAMRAAMTGHLVLSTLHTYDAESSALRLIDMGVPRYMLAATLQAMVSQRLVRLLCPHCAVPDEPGPEVVAWLRERAAPGRYDPSRLMRETGCPKCNGLGYTSRAAVFEMLEMDEALREALLQEHSRAFKNEARSRLQGKRLADSVLDLVFEGRTSAREAMLMLDSELDD